MCTMHHAWGQNDIQGLSQYTQSHSYLVVLCGLVQEVPERTESPCTLVDFVNGEFERSNKLRLRNGSMNNLHPPGLHLNVHA